MVTDENLYLGSSFEIIINKLFQHAPAIVNCHKAQKNGAAVTSEALFKVAADSNGRKTPKEMEELVNLNYLIYSRTSHLLILIFIKNLSLKLSKRIQEIRYLLNLYFNRIAPPPLQFQFSKFTINLCS